ncbi:4-hydroxy-tetrahydrodipicolinate reductase [Parafilimonas terrae]|uniref:4-hydroxy-tetrahydrodipicolinate reductase n=1 Tax=Parafilimonas terrae TaxID=1465490 RepID=A0A1I5YPF0_9BACT|nr:4-hydroxy-tetrahydrodipicolinate reductase [Parafilimonas terrae]SFQ45807.1 dihydrodipicolinate reductase [Parafilimonas terrae]
MKIALIGYGKMGKAIEAIAKENGDEIVLKISSSNQNEFTADNLKQADAAIEFTNPHSAVENIKKCLDANIPVVCGTTGWLKDLPEIKNYIEQKNGTFLFASNFSVGVNLFFALNEYLASLMSSHQEYEVSVEEVHHTQKKDAPSGTAITLAEQLIEKIKTKKSWVNDKTNNESELEIISKRIDDVPGIHTIKYNSPIDYIEIKHSAYNRKGFAGGALLAAKFIAGKKGIFTMKDVLGL